MGNSVAIFRSGNDTADRHLAELEADVAKAADRGLLEALKSQQALVAALHCEIERLRGLIASSDMPVRKAVQITATHYTKRYDGGAEFVYSSVIALASDGTIWSRSLVDGGERGGWVRQPALPQMIDEATGSDRHG